MLLSKFTMTTELSPNKPLTEILVKLGPASTIMSYYGDYFDTFLVLNSLSKRVKERFIHNKKWYSYIEWKDQRRYWKITKFDEKVVEKLLFNHLYQNLVLDIFIWEESLDYFKKDFLMLFPTQKIYILETVRLSLMT